ncbi:CFI-box-CTERM domain-containing protein [Haladaptatus sp. NG-WS-4]
MDEEPDPTDGEGADAEDFEGVGDGRKKHVVVVTSDGERYEEGDAFLRHADDAFVVSKDPEFDPAETRRFEKAELREVEVSQHHTNCFVTTAVAGEGRTLALLREFRDDAMAATPVGRALVRVYYAVSPPVAATLERHPDSRTARIVRALIDACAVLARWRRRSNPVGRVGLSLLLTVLYVVGVVVAVGGHAVVRTRETSNRVN